MALFVVKSIVIQIKDQDYRSNNKAVLVTEPSFKHVNVNFTKSSFSKD